jgi:hypothetical protein
MPSDPEQAAARVRAALELASKRDDHEYTMVSVSHWNEFAEAFVTLGDLRALLAERGRLGEENERLRGERAIADNARLHAELRAARAAATPESP